MATTHYSSICRHWLILLSLKFYFHREIYYIKKYYNIKFFGTLQIISIIEVLVGTHLFTVSHPQSGIEHMVSLYSNFT